VRVHDSQRIGVLVDDGVHRHFRGRVVRPIHVPVPGSRVWSMSLIIGLGSFTHSIERTIESRSFPT